MEKSISIKTDNGGEERTGMSKDWKRKR